MEHAGRVLEALIGKNHSDHRPRLRRWAKRLLKDKVEDLIEQTRGECAGKSQAPGVKEALQFRRIHASQRLDQFWKYHLNAAAAENDPLPMTG
jgi:hypothetical protein